MQKALITGRHSFTGHYLALELERAGYQVYGIVLDDNQKGVNDRSVDICDLKSLKTFVNEVQPDVVAHLAAVSFVGYGNAEAIYRTNVIGARNLLLALAECNKKPNAVLLASSANIYGNASDDPIRESTPANPANDYAVSKLAMEHMAGLWRDRLPIIIVRPFNYTGVGQSLQFLLPKIVDHFRRGLNHIELGNVNVARDFSDVRTVACAYQRLIELAPTDKVFNICSERSVSLQEVLNMMADIAGYQIQVKTNPDLVRSNEVNSLRGSNSTLLKAIGELSFIPLEKTLKWMYESS